MGNLLTTTMCNAVANTLFTIDALKSGVVQKPGELSEGIVEAPTVQVYPDEASPITLSGQTERTSFGTPDHEKMKRQTDFIIHIDLYARQRKAIGEDMAALINLIDPIIAKMEEQSVAPFFGIDGVRAFSWTSQRVTFIYGDAQVPYIGWRWILTFRVF